MRTTFLPAILVLLAGGALVRAQEPRGVARVLLDRHLDERPITLTGLDDRTIRYTDAAGLPRSEPSVEYLAILPAPGPAAPAPTRRAGAPAEAPEAPAKRRETEGTDHAVAGPVLELTDGQRFAGQLDPTEGARDTLRWSSPALGVSEFKFDQVRRLRLHDGAWVASSAPGDQDLLILSNGDRLRGLVDSIGADLGFSVGEEKSGPRRIPLARLYEIVFSNPPVAPAPRAAVAWLRDGSVIACREIKTSRTGEVSLSLQESEAADNRAESKGQGSLKLDDLLAVSFEAGGAMVRPLATIEPVSQSPANGRRWSRRVAAIDPDRAVLGAADLEFPGPMTIAWDLPKGVSRFAAQAELPLQSRTWGDCDFVVSAAAPQGDKELFRQHLSADAPVAPISVGLPEGATRLTIRIEAGPLGPIQDRVVLHRPLLLVGK